MNLLKIKPVVVEFPDIKTPEYTTGVFGDWELTIAQVPVVFGYFVGLQEIKGVNYVLRNNQTKTVWMSLTPMELESHMPHLKLAHGHVVVGGLGMGMYLYNLCLKPEVTKITVVEKDPDILKAFPLFSGCHEWAGWGKVSILHEDILSLTDAACVGLWGCDHLYVDIWPVMGDNAAVGDMQTICESIRPKQASWWCQEFDYFEHLKTKMSPEDASEKFMLDNGIPAAGHLLPNYTELTYAAMLNSLMGFMAR